MRIPRKSFPPGVVREVRQYAAAYDFAIVIRWDFAYRDPASGAWMQVGADAMIAKDVPDSDVERFVREPAVACLEREIHRKCGMAYALANRIPLELPRHGAGRYV